MKRAVAVLLLAALGSACSSTSSSLRGEQAKSVERLNWSEGNHRVLDQFIADHGRGGRYRDDARPGYVVLDWDNTTAQFDVQEAVMRFQARNLRYKLTKDEFRALLPDSVNGVTRFPEANGSILLADIHADLASDYAFLYDGYSGLGGTQPLETVVASPRFQDFFVKLHFLLDAYLDTPGIGGDYAFPWVIYLLSGHTIAEVKTLAREAISRELGTELARVVLRSPAGLATRAGVVECSFDSGLRAIPEMQDLIATFQANGLDVFVVSASFKPVVETFGAPGNFGYGVPAANVVAMELATDAKGVILPRYREGWPKTYGQGKVDAIVQAIQVGLGKRGDPLFTAGDGDGDYEMLTAFPGTKLSLVWNRVRGGAIGRLSRRAIEEQALASPRYILQGRNENAGVTLPGPESIRIGQTVPRLFAP